MNLNTILLKVLARHIAVILFVIIYFQLPGMAQMGVCQIKGIVTSEGRVILSGATVEINPQHQTSVTDNNGYFVFNNMQPGNFIVKVTMQGFKTLQKNVNISTQKYVDISFNLKPSLNELNEVIIKGYKAITGMGYLNDVHNGVIYSGKKTEVILLDSLNANTAQNNPRQVLGRIPGANYSETEGSGFPSNGIGFRGLTPTQSVETNTRQNGYNITADIFGYPETYYLPPLEAVERIEVTRGAASLQFGPQFGGVINYIIKQAPKYKPLEFDIEQTGGSFGLFNSFTSAGGTIGKFNYYSFLQYKNIQGWRPNSHVQQVSAFVGINYLPTEKLKLSLEYSMLRNRIQMPGGFDDAQFNLDSRASYRARNWLNSPWNIITGKAAYQFSNNTKLLITSTQQFSSRNLVWKNEDGGPGQLDTISTTTLEPVNREVQREQFKSTTNEVRFTANYNIGAIKNTLATGLRAFYGKMNRMGGGIGTTGSGFDLTILDPHYGYNLQFTTVNIAPFAENIFYLTDRISITPGIRLEYIKSSVNGYVDTDNKELVSNKAKSRYVTLAGLGAQFQITPTVNIYANISQAYRPVTYDQLTPFGSAAKIDPDMKDAFGYNADLGVRGSVKNYFNFDISGFYLSYNNRIGLIEKTDGQGQSYILRTNVANSVHQGFESYIELNITRAFFPDTHIGDISFYNSFAFVDARYTTGSFKGNYVEYAPRTINRLGISYSRKPFSTTFLISNTALSYSDAANAISSTDPAVGLIPAFQVMDWSGKVKLNRYNLKFGVNNLTDKRYFTIRTNEYPGPGIIPAVGRSFYVGIGAKF